MHYVCVYSIILLYIIVLLCFGVSRCYLFSFFLFGPGSWTLRSWELIAAEPWLRILATALSPRVQHLGVMSGKDDWGHENCQIGNIENIGKNIGNIQSIWIPEFQNSPHLQLLILGESKLSIPICKQAGHRCLTIASSAFLCCLRTSGEEAMPSKLGQALAKLFEISRFICHVYAIYGGYITIYL